jgi:two-component system sensor histidine kinase MprB
MAELRADVLAQIAELSTLVGDLVDLTRDDRREVVHEQVDISEVVDRSMERVRRRRNDIEFDIEAIPWQVYGDAAGLSRAVLNLLDNAAKWSPPGGRVGLRMTQVDSSHVELVVSDQGPGIPPHERPLVFERFFRSASARAMPGSGLGLAIVKQVVVKHGGTLSIEDTTPGDRSPGTSIHVVLPGRLMPADVAAAGATERAVDDAGDPVTQPDEHKSAGASNTVSDDSQSAQAGW